MLSGFRGEVDENCGPVSYYAVKSGTSEIGPIGCPETLHNSPEQRSSLQINAVHTHQSYLHMNRFNIILRFVSICFQVVSLSFFLPNPYVHISSPPYMPYAPTT